MISRVVMPKLTDTMEEGVLVAWKKHEGDRVEAGEVIAEIETDKAVMDLEAFASGILRKILQPTGSFWQINSNSSPDSSLKSPGGFVRITRL